MSQLLVSPDGLTTVSLLPPSAAPAFLDVRDLRLNVDQIPPPAPLWVTPDDFLQIFYAANTGGIGIQAIGRIILPNGRIASFGLNLTTVGDRVVRESHLPLQYGYLVAASLFSFGSPTPKRGQVLGALQLSKQAAGGLEIHYFMGMDYLTTIDSTAWPYSRITTGPEGPGVLTSFKGTVPVTGADWSQTVPTGARWRIKALHNSLVTSAVVANRTVSIWIDDGLNLFGIFGADAAQPASATYHYSAGPGALRSTSSLGYINIPLVEAVWLPGGSRIYSITNSLLGGDAWGATQFLVEEVLEA